jgi:hypothetical protein
MVNSPRVRFEGVKAGDGFGAGSLIFMPISFLLTTFLVFRGGGRVAVALRLPGQVFEGSTLGILDEALTDLALRVRTEMGTTRINMSPSKPGMGAMKLSKACKQAYEE